MSNFSNHVFLFPFKWQVPGRNSHEQRFSELADLETADALVRGDSRWQTDAYRKFEHTEDYAEFMYFYPFVRDVLYDYKSEPEQNTLIRHYEFKPAAEGGVEYIIHIKEGSTYTLDVSHILLNLYKTGVGILSFHLYNGRPGQLEWNDILRINEYGRRTYPQFLDNDFGPSWAKGSMLADRIEIVGSGVNPFVIEEDFEAQTGLTRDLRNAVPKDLDLVPHHIDRILPKPFFERIRSCMQPLVDDRMFVVSAYYDGDKRYKDKVANVKKGEDGQPVFAMADDLYRYTFVDTPGIEGVSNPFVRDELLEKHSYRRWLSTGTFYGVCRYAFVSYSDMSYIPVHTRTMYYKMAELCLVQRASVLNFTEEISRISRLEHGSARQLSAQLDDLYKAYIQFVNKIYFREVTAQEQGIELYDMLHENMRIREEIKDLDNEIGELHNYVMLQEEGERNKQLAMLTVLGAVFLLPSFLLSFLGAAGNLPEGFSAGRWGLIGMLVAIGVVPALVFRKMLFGSGRGGMLLRVVAAVFMTALAIGLLWLVVGYPSTK